MGQLAQDWQDWLVSIAVLVLVALAAILVHRLLFAAADRAARRTTSVIDESLVEHLRHPARVLAPLVALIVVLPLVPLPLDVREPLQHLAGLGIIGTAAWAIVALTWLADDIVLARFHLDERDNLEARAVRTQISILRRVVVVGVVVVTIAIMLLTLPGAENLGASLLASAGVVGLVVGVAARPVLSNLLAGIQIALTQPIRLDDVVVIDGEWGRIEEITTTYVVVRIWDLRRLIVPLSSVIDQSFENWTRRTSNILGTVMLYADYSVPVDEVRSELKRILDASGLWDGAAWGLQVTGATERTVELRALVSAADSSAAWDLRCIVRERLIAFLGAQHPDALPRLRTEPQNPVGPTSASD